MAAGAINPFCGSVANAIEGASEFSNKLAKGQAQNEPPKVSPPVPYNTHLTPSFCMSATIAEQYVSALSGTTAFDINWPFIELITIK